jgi:predicted nucleic-acid-binding Zn-ribbon protein
MRRASGRVAHLHLLVIHLLTMHQHSRLNRGRQTFFCKIYQWPLLSAFCACAILNSSIRARERLKIMRDGICPKCGNATIFCKERGMGFDYAIKIDRLFPTSPKLFTFICTTCGYFENYIAAPKVLEQIAKQWDYVEPDTDEIEPPPH